MDLSKYIRDISTGVIEIAIEKDKRVLGNGSAFLAGDGLITNSHVIRPPGNFDAFRIRFSDGQTQIRLLPKDFYGALAAESPASSFDFAYVRIDEPELQRRYRFDLGSSEKVELGNEVLFLGFPFGMPQLTVHRGYVSSIHSQDGRDIIQIDGSVNGGNSGGPLIDLKSRQVVGIVTRAVTGIVEQEFDNLISALAQNVEVLGNTKTVIQVGGIDPIQGLRASQSAMQQIAQNLKRSANVGIGYAFAIDPVKAEMNCA